MAFGFAGAHRTGKTTLAKRVAEELGWYYHDASVSKVMREAGINAVGDVPIAQRIEAQEFLLKRYLADLQFAPRPMVTDRTPLDMISYMLGEITMHNTDAATGDRVHKYTTDCITATLTHFDTIIMVRPLNVYKVEEGKPPLNRGYQDVVQLLAEGAAALVEPQMYIERMVPSDLDERVAYSKDVFTRRMAEIAAESKQMRWQS